MDLKKRLEWYKSSIDRIVKDNPSKEKRGEVYYPLTPDGAYSAYTKKETKPHNTLGKSKKILLL